MAIIVNKRPCSGDEYHSEEGPSEEQYAEPRFRLYLKQYYSKYRRYAKHPDKHIFLPLGQRLPAA